MLSWKMLVKPNITVGWSNPEIIITTNRQYRQCLCLEAWHKNSTNFLLNHDDGSLLPENYLHLINNNKCSLLGLES